MAAREADFRTVDSVSRVDEVLATAGALVYAFDPLGGGGVPVPAELEVAPDRVLEADGPLDLLTPATQGDAVVAFEHARREGQGGALVQHRDHDVDSWLEVIDLTEDHGCFLAVLVPHDPTVPLERVATTLAPRRAAYELNVTGVIIDVDEDFSAMLGWEPDQVIGESSLAFIHPDDHEAGIVAWVDLLETPGNMTRLRQRFRRTDGSWVWCECTDYNELHSERPHVLGEIIDISREVTAEAELQRRESILDRLYRALPTGVVVIDADGDAVVQNERWAELIGGAGDRPLETLLEALVDRADAVALFGRAADRHEDGDLAVELTGVGSCRFGMLHVRPLGEPGQGVGLLVTLDDMTAQREQERVLADQMRRDPLTGAFNRRGVEDVLAERLEQATGAAGVLYLDLDDFKSVNDTHGHARGDAVLIAVTDAVQRLLHDDDVIGRIGGDEFLVVLGSVDRAGGLAEAIASRVDEIARSMDDSVALGVSIGSASAQPGDDFDRLISRADEAMYADKSSRRADGRRDRRRPDQPPRR